MSILVVQLPPRARVTPRGAPAVENGALAELQYVHSTDGRTVGAQGRCAPALLPRADSVVAVVGEADVAWHRIALPRAPAARLRAALVGVLEEELLDDPAQVHLALPPRPIAGASTWVAAVDRRWLHGELLRLDAAHVGVDRVVPAAAPGAEPTLHFSAPADAPEAVTVTWADADGVLTLPLAGGLAHARLPDPLPDALRATATPAAAAQAEHWLGAPVDVQGGSERLLQAARSDWNLRQFDLARKTRGVRAVALGWHRLFSPELRVLRHGALALLVVHVVGLNLAAWQQRNAIDTRSREVTAVLQTAFPHVRAVLDAPLQMEREMQVLRARAGRPGDDDLEPMLAAAAAAWPTERPPVESLRFEPGQLSLAAPGWAAAEVDRLRERLTPAGWQVAYADNRVTLTRRRAATAPRAAL